MNDILEITIGLESPDEGFRIFIVHGDILLDGGDQILSPTEDTTLQSVSGYTAEKALKHIEAMKRSL